MEDLQIKNMIQNHHLAKAIQDAGWAQLVQFIGYKEARAGGKLVLVDPAFTTQTCFFCKFKNKVDLSQRVFSCGGCGRLLHRDYNAAFVIMEKGLGQVGQGMPELTPVEIAMVVVEAGTSSNDWGNPPL
jgi:putative transposase